jgi:N-acetylmuramoyl-L-alanine amidase
VSLLTILAIAALSASGDELRLTLEGAAKTRVVLDSNNKIYLEAQPLKGEGLLAFTRRFCGDESLAMALRGANGGSRKLLASHWYRVPLDLLAPDVRRQVLKVLLPGDTPVAEGWQHRVGTYRGLPDETLWRIAERFTGDGQNYRQIRSANAMADDTVRPGERLLIPFSLLTPPFRHEHRLRMGAASPAPAAMAPAAVATTQSPAVLLEAPGLAMPAVVPPADPQLRYDRDAQGEVAVYRLKPGEALYSAVVVRYTGRIYAADVNALAAEIAQRSGIRDVTDIAVGYPVKIPFEVLQPEFLPPGHPQRLEYEASRRASDRFSNTVRSQDLAGITILLDAGHGGRDIGTSKLGVWESVYVYDIMVRLKHHLEKTTAAEVFATTQEGSGHRVVNQDVLPFSTGHAVLTTPPYSLLEDSKVGVNLRWYLANSLYRQALRRGRKPENVIFISIHADSLHPSLRGAMAYIPDADLRRGSFERGGAVYASRKEVREKPKVSYSLQHRRKSEGLSRQLADQIIQAFRRSGLPVHPDQPVRQKIYRGRQPWVPAVLRYNEVPAELLVEVCNLANDEDRRLLTSRAFRQQAAEALADGIRAYYDSPTRGEAAAVAKLTK